MSWLKAGKSTMRRQWVGFGGTSKLSPIDSEPHLAPAVNPNAEVERVKGARGGLETSRAGACRDRLRQDAIQLRRSG